MSCLRFPHVYPTYVAPYNMSFILAPTTGASPWRVYLTYLVHFVRSVPLSIRPPRPIMSCLRFPHVYPTYVSHNNMSFILASTTEASAWKLYLTSLVHFVRSFPLSIRPSRPTKPFLRVHYVYPTYVAPSNMSFILAPTTGASAWKVYLTSLVHFIRSFPLSIRLLRSIKSCLRFSHVYPSHVPH